MGYMAATVKRSTKVKRKRIKVYYDVTAASHTLFNLSNMIFMILK